MKSSKQFHARGHRAKSKQQDNSKEFDKYYNSVYGSRWPSLREALLKPTVHAAMANTFIRPAATAACVTNGLVPFLSLGPMCAYLRPKPAGSYPPPPLDPASALRMWYWLDLASVLPVLLLQPRRGHSALDMCAAPGGKSVLTAQHLFVPAAPLLAPPSAPPLAAAATPPASAGPSEAAAGSGTADKAAQLYSQSMRQEPVAVVEAGMAAATVARAEVTDVDTTAATAARPAVANEEDGDTSEELHPGEVDASRERADASEGTAPHHNSYPTPPPPKSLAVPPRLPLNLPPGKLICNEPDRQRLQRLQRVLEEYVPVSMRANLEALNYQGHAYWGRNQACCYDRVLVDAPCSSDRHVLQQAASAQRGVIAAADWSLAGCKRIADEQLQLCLAGLRALRVGGRLVYSTCSIAPLQNDDVVERLIRRCGPGVVRVLPAMEALRVAVAAEVDVQAGLAEKAAPVKLGNGGEGSGGRSFEDGERMKEAEGSGWGTEVGKVLGVEATRHGLICLPDRGAWGPIYVAVMEKVGEMQGMGVAAVLRPQPTGVSDGEDEGSEEEEGDEGKEGQQE
ncbi:hypothetical protein VaNZ11_000537 [Volvox africanus]|uniref:NOL1/NOP2/Sun domain family member 4 n=1 Tax=Volvox africanus TaxID=51714 RepID=A0ABQ5RMX3_9CHLO|nr:hypothetical protein VaNZ11_000537 [Volvox africanus]